MILIYDHLERYSTNMLCVQHCLKGSSIRNPMQQPSIKGKKTMQPRVQLNMTTQDTARKPHSSQDRLFLCWTITGHCGSLPLYVQLIMVPTSSRLLVELSIDEHETTFVNVIQMLTSHTHIGSQGGTPNHISIANSYLTRCSC